MHYYSPKLRPHLNLDRNVDGLPKYLGKVWGVFIAVAHPHYRSDVEHAVLTKLISNHSTPGKLGEASVLNNVVIIISAFITDFAWPAIAVPRTRVAVSRTRVAL